jgi:hypothetical protein
MSSRRPASIVLDERPGTAGGSKLLGRPMSRVLDPDPDSYRIGSVFADLHPNFEYGSGFTCTNLLYFENK